MTELQPVQDLRIFSNNLITFKIDLRKLWSHRPIWSLKRAHHRSRFKAAWSRNRHERSKFKILLHIRPQRYSGEIPIESDIIHVSGGDAERDFEDDHLAPPNSHGRPLTSSEQLILMATVDHWADISRWYGKICVEYHCINASIATSACWEYILGPRC